MREADDDCGGIIFFRVPGEPKGKARPRFNYYTGAVYTEDKTTDYEDNVKRAYREAAGTYRFKDGKGIRISIFAFFKIPKSASKRTRQLMLRNEIQVTKKPDADNIAKIICDALNGIAYKDDAQITFLSVKKAWKEGESGVYVHICEDNPEL